MSKKDVHRTGALGAILGGKGLKSAQDILSDPNKKDQFIKSDTVQTLQKTTPSDVTTLTLIEISPDVCRPWQYANRAIEEFGDLDALAKSMKNEGQQEPILVRPTEDKSLPSSIRYEIIFGRRRYEAAKQANLQLIAIIKSLTDKEAVLAQKAENENREPVSPYSEAFHYRKLLETGCFKSEAELSRELNIPKATLNNALAFTKIPAEIIKLIPNIHNISARIAVSTVKLLNEHDQNYDIIKQLAPTIGKSITSAKQLEQKVLAFKNKPTTTSVKQATIETNNGQPLFKITYSEKKAPTIILDKSLKQKITVEELTKALKEYIESII